MKTMRTLVVDDEPASRNGLIKLLSDHKNIEIIGQAHNASAFRNAMIDIKPDLVFLDVMLRNANSLDVLNQIDTQAMLIITTAYGQHALRGFDLRAIDYLMKPIFPERLNIAIERAHTIYSASGSTPETLFLKSDGRYHRLKTQDILFIQGMENYIVVQTLSAKFVCKMTMTYIRHLLSNKQFIQIHKSYIINSFKVDALEKLNVYIQTFELPISREKRHEVYQALLGPDTFNSIV